MKIAVKSGKDGGWKRIPNGDHKEDIYVRDLIHQIPELISAEDMEPGSPNLRVCIKIQSANIPVAEGGLIGIDANGSISIVGCKIPNDSTVRREIMGQALEYAASLWEMPYEEFDSMVLDSEGKSLIELMRAKVSTDKWSEEEFKNAVISSLRHGRFRLIITVNGLNNELRRTIKFLNARGPFSFETYALEIQHFSDGQIEVVVPRLMSFAESESQNSAEMPISSQEENPVKSNVVNSKPSPKVSNPPEPSIAKPKQDPVKAEHKEALFFSKCRESVNKNVMEIIRKVHNFSKETADDIIWWGSSGAGAFNFVLTEDGLTVFIVDANGKIMFNFSEWQREPTYKDLLPQFLEKLRGISILRKQKEDYTRWPDFNVEEFFASNDDFKTFEDSIKFLKDELRKLAVL